MGAHFINVYVSHNVKFLTNKVTMPFADASNCISAGPNVRAHHGTVRSAPKPIPVLSSPVYAPPAYSPPVYSAPVYSPPVVRSPAVYGGGYGGGDVRPMSSGGTIAGVIVAILVIGGLIFLGVFGSHKGWYTSSSGSSSGYSTGGNRGTGGDVVVGVQTKEHPAIGTWIGPPFNTTVTAYNQTSFTWSLNPSTNRLGWYMESADNDVVVGVQTKEHPAIGTWIGHPFNTTITPYNQTRFTQAIDPSTGRLGWSTDVRRRLVLRVADGKLDQIKF